MRLDSGQAAHILDPFFEEGTYDVLRTLCEISPVSVKYSDTFCPKLDPTKKNIHFLTGLGRFRLGFQVNSTSTPLRHQEKLQQLLWRCCMVAFQQQHPGEKSEFCCMVLMKTDQINQHKASCTSLFFWKEDRTDVALIEYWLICDYRSHNW